MKYTIVVKNERGREFTISLTAASIDAAEQEVLRLGCGNWEVMQVVSE